MQSKWAPHFALIGANLVYGLNYSIAKFSLPAFIPPFAYIVLRVFFGALLFWMVSAFLPKEKIDRKDVFLLVTCSLFGVFANQILFFWGLAETHDINAALIMISVPILVLLIAVSMGKEAVFV